MLRPMFVMPAVNDIQCRSDMKNHREWETQRVSPIQHQLKAKHIPDKMRPRPQHQPIGRQRNRSQHHNLPRHMRHKWQQRGNDNHQQSGR